MRGSPLLRAAVALAVLLLLLVPLRSFTTARAQKPVDIEAAPASKTPAHLEIVSTKSPFEFSVKHLGKILWQGSSAMESTSKDLTLPIPREGVDLALEIAWPGGGTAAAKLILTHDDNDPVERTVWGDGRASDVLTFP